MSPLLQSSALDKTLQAASAAAALIKAGLRASSGFGAVRAAMMNSGWTSHFLDHVSLLFQEHCSVEATEGWHGELGGAHQQHTHGYERLTGTSGVLCAHGLSHFLTSTINNHLSARYDTLQKLGVASSRRFCNDRTWYLRFSRSSTHQCTYHNEGQQARKDLAADHCLFSITIS